MHEAVGGLPIIVYPGQSVETQLISQELECLIREYSGKWIKKALILPYVMVANVEAKADLRLNHAHIQELTDQIKEIVQALPQEHQPPYNYFIKILERKNAVVKINVPRAIEFLALVSCRYVLDQIRQRHNTDETPLQGFVLKSELLPSDPSRKDEDWTSTKLWIFHGLGKKLDALMMECFKLGEDKITKIIHQQPMDLVNILNIKVEKYLPSIEETKPT